MNQRSADLAGGSRHYHLQPNLLNLPVSHYREKKSLSAAGTVSGQDRKGEGKWGNLRMCRRGVVLYSTVMSVNTFIHPPRNLIKFN